MESNKQAEMEDSMTAEIITLRDGNDQGRQLPPPGMNNNLLLANETPGIDAGSFSLEVTGDEYNGKFLFPFDPSWKAAKPDYDMLAVEQLTSSAEALSGDTIRANIKRTFTQELPIAYDTFRRYPIDPLSGLPYPILLIDSSKDEPPLRVDYHHQFHPRQILVCSKDPADKALRVCRGQDLPRWLHDRYHARYDGPALPTTRQEKFATVVLACAGVVPRKAMYLGDNTSILMTPSEDQYRKIQSTLHYEYASKTGQSTRDRSKAKLGTFFAQYALEQNIRDSVDDTMINNFLSPRTDRERMLIGNKILEAAVFLATEPIRPQYLDAFKEQGLNDQKPRNLTHVVTAYFHPARKKDYFTDLAKRLAA